MDHGLGTGIRVRSVSKSYGGKRVLDDVSFDIPAGTVTGLLGPNGSGKSTAMRSMLGLTIADAGSTTFDGVPYRDLAQPGRTVGALLDPGAHHPGRSVRDTLASAAILAGVPLERARELTGTLGLATAERRRFGALSLGMKQRVALALALLGRPRHLILDEPMNGLDIETADWLRKTLVHHAHTTGGSVLVSTHLLQELQTFADRIVVLSEGAIRYSGDVNELTSGRNATVVAVDPDLMRRALTSRGIPFTTDADGSRFAVGVDPRSLSQICIADAIVIDELAEDRESISDLYRRLTRGQYHVEGDVLDLR
ncbi:putative ABC transporter ATP-binding protein YxlF [Microbacterium oleivorans]|uniref:ATP-binding cassette domain-containing protein n=1 Tax=Microbacterium oleivorans TaxID=273677 RepID=UPI0009779CA2|nr:ATP-binding cassette domain-containing protein [Microbacterium oleivorans]AZS42725.1 putative ABC transporter ATP-binding protein YxlF [Microbacterium oleivorans]